jgi:DDE domain
MIRLRRLEQATTLIANGTQLARFQVDVLPVRYRFAGERPQRAIQDVQLKIVRLWCNQQRIGIITKMKTTSPESPSLFKGRHFDSSVIILCVRWYITYKLSYRDLRDMMAERGIDLAHTTILRWVQHYVPEFDKKWNRFARPVGTSWRMDETYIRVRGEWKYLYRAVDQ